MSCSVLHKPTACYVELSVSSPAAAETIASISYFRIREHVFYICFRFKNITLYGF